MKHEPENDAVLRLLGWSDVALRRTMLGCLYLLAVVVPDWIHQCRCDMIDFGSSFLYQASKTATRLSIYGFRVAYMVARVSLVALGWGVVIFSPLGIVVMASANWLVWPSITWSLVLMFGSLSGYLRWRALEDRARDEWKDVVVKGRTIQEWIDVISGTGVTPFERKTAILILFESGTKGQMALMAALTIDEAIPMNVIMKQWILAVVAELGQSASRFELTIHNLHRTSTSEQVRRASLSALTKIGARTEDNRLPEEVESINSPQGFPGDRSGLQGQYGHDK